MWTAQGAKLSVMTPLFTATWRFSYLSDPEGDGGFASTTASAAATATHAADHESAGGELKFLSDESAATKRPTNRGCASPEQTMQ